MPYVADDADLMNDVDLTGQFFQLAGTFAQLLPEHEEDYDKTDPLIVSVCNYLRSKFSINPTGVLNGFCQFPTSFLATIEIDLIQLFMSIVHKTEYDIERMTLFLSKWMQRDINDMPRSLFLGTIMAPAPVMKKNTGKLDEDRSFLLNRLDNWTTNPALAAIKLSISGTSSDLKTIYSQIINLPSLFLQYWFIRLEFIRSLERFVRYSVMSLHNDPQCTSQLREIVEFLQDRICNGQTVSSISYSILMWSWTRGTIGFIEGNKEYLMETIDTLRNQRLISGRFVKNEEVMTTNIFALKFLYDYFERIGGQPHDNLQNRAFLSPNGSWAEFAYELCFDRFWINFFSAQTDFLTRIDTESVYGKMVQQIFDLETMIDKAQFASQLSSKEPQAYKGLFNYCVGRAAERDGGRGLEWIKDGLQVISTPGPTMKKLDICTIVAGLLNIGGDAAANIDHAALVPLRAILKRSIEISSDPRLISCLLVLFNRVLDCSGEEDIGSVQALSNPSVFNRFGLERPFGVCLEVLLDRSETSMIASIIAAMIKVNSLPKIDWTCLIDLIPTKFLFKHLRSAKDGLLHYNQSILNALIVRLERGEAAITNYDVESIGVLIDATSSDQESSNRLILAISEAALNDERITRQIIRGHEHFDLGLMKNLVAKISGRDLQTWMLISELGILFTPLTSFLVNGKIEDAIIAIIDDPSLLDVIASALVTKNALPHLSTYYYLAFQDGADTSILSRLIFKVLILHSHPIVINLPDNERLAWHEYCKRSHDEAAFIVRRIRPLIPLLHPSDDMCLLGSLV